MIRGDLGNLPVYDLPAPFGIRDFRHGEGDFWAEIEHAAAEFKSVEKARQHFEEEFGAQPNEFSRRCQFLTTGEGRVIGTATAWFNASFQGKLHGQLHWVAILPEFQGRALSKPLVGAAMNRMKAYHDRAFLTSQTTSWKAIKVYLDFGFLPLIESPEHHRGWRLLQDKLRHPCLESFV